MDNGQLRFYQRVRSLDRKHRAMDRGYSTYVRPDGLIVARPRAARPRLWLRPVIFGLAGFLMFKSFLIAGLGAQVYAERVDRLEAGTVVEQAGAWAMQPDRLSQYIAGFIAPYLP